MKSALGGVPIRIRPGSTFESLFRKVQSYAYQEGWFKNGAKLKFVFDGDVVQPNQTPAELDMEDDMIVEVVETNK